MKKTVKKLSNQVGATPTSDSRPAKRRFVIFTSENVSSSDGLEYIPNGSGTDTKDS